jgi:hypothetical protein
MYRPNPSVAWAKCRGYNTASRTLGINYKVTVSVPSLNCSVLSYGSNERITSVEFNPNYAALPRSYSLSYLVAACTPKGDEAVHAARRDLTALRIKGDTNN